MGRRILNCDDFSSGPCETQKHVLCKRCTKCFGTENYQHCCDDCLERCPSCEGTCSKCHLPCNNRRGDYYNESRKIT